MKGSAKVIEALQMLIDNELAARDQYFIHSGIYKDMGLNNLYERLNHEMQEETEHAQQMVDRMLFLEGKPDFNNRAAVNAGSDVEEMLKNDLEMEYRTVNNLKSVIEVCESENDFDTRDGYFGCISLYFSKDISSFFSICIFLFVILHKRSALLHNTFLCPIFK